MSRLNTHSAWTREFPRRDGREARTWTVLAVALVLALTACGRASAPGHPTQVATFSGTVMGTDYHVTLILPRPDFDTRAASRAVEDALNRVDLLMSTYKPDAELSRFNAHRDTTPFPVSPETVEVITIAQRVSEMSDGAFDITVGPLVRAWGFGPDPYEGPPSGETIAGLLKRVGWRNLRLEGQSLVKTCPELECDLSAIAKGYAVDLAALALENLGVANYLVEVGGEVRTHGHNRDNRPWRIGIEAPITGERQVRAVALLSGMSLASSGNYRNFHEVDGKRLGHTIDPRSGRPVENGPDAVSVARDSCAWADALATALMAMPFETAWEKALEWNLAACVMAVDPETKEITFRATPAMQSLLDPEFP
ncbi:MAG TPA: FAD:protein FMN transferase [Candidatus Hydrogenedentes bacterium]|nr:FAD:protein FMN transferase [Candidatus Hydrogenedentota bacterium]